MKIIEAKETRIEGRKCEKIHLRILPKEKDGTNESHLSELNPTLLWRNLQIHESIPLTTTVFSSSLSISFLSPNELFSSNYCLNRLIPSVCIRAKIHASQLQMVGFNKHKHRRRRMDAIFTKSFSMVEFHIVQTDSWIVSWMSLWYDLLLDNCNGDEIMWITSDRAEGEREKERGGRKREKGERELKEE